MSCAARPDTGLDLDSPFWRFALRLYAQPGVSPLCLALQDENGIDVNLLLFACWCGSIGRMLDANAVATVSSQTRPWTEAVVTKLREARRAWKEIGPDAVQAKTGRETLKSIELLSERIVCAMLYAAHESLGARARETASPIDNVPANVGLVLARAGVAPPRIEAASALLGQACRAAS